MKTTARHWLLGVCLIGGAGTASAADLTGVYCDAQGNDTLIVDDQGDSVRFELSSWQGGGHHCGTGRQTAVRRGDHFEVTDGACTLTLAGDDAFILLEASPSDGCTRQYCGARASLTSLRLPLSSRTPLPMAFEDISLMETLLCQ
ncbi:hypothetical protein [Halomonas sp. YLGW01]|uniref:hypothetical protein n=1 Tax=Halomonas sp. YLGW01 TaxID=2773308 RepID=UPI0017811681|nr:hypothetical protein [Halomonas sp. YLGW01]